MNDSKDRRSHDRIACNIPVYISYFHSIFSVEAQLVNHCINGISVISDQAFFLESTIVLRVAPCYTLMNSENRNISILQRIKIGEVKWCRKLPEVEPTAFEVGVKYHSPFYYK